MALAERAQALAKGATMVRQESRQDSRQDPAAREAPPPDNQDKSEIAQPQVPAEAASTPAPEPAAGKRPASADLLPSVDWDFG